MRVIAGTLKGRRLTSPSWEGLRPTSDKLRETLFNVLAPRVGGARVLDVYAGTGAVGIEALSRGAAAVTFVERDRRAQALIVENLERCGITSGYTMIRSDALQALTSLRGHGAAGTFDLVLLDPPYRRNPAEGAVGPVLAAAGELLAPGGWAILEHARRAAVPEVAGPLERIRQIVSGDSALTVYATRI